MGYAWSSRDRLAPMRMVACDHHYPKYDIIKYRKPSLRKMTKLEIGPRLRVEECRFASDYPPGRLGEWPVFRYGRRKSR